MLSLSAPAFAVKRRHIVPDTDRPVFFPVVYLNHFDPELRAGIGHDHFTDPKRKPSMEQARDTGQAKATAKVFLNRDSTNYSRGGFVIYLPVYRAGASVTTVAERQSSLQGFIFANFESDKFMQGIFGEQANGLVKCEVFDGTVIDRDHLLYGDTNLNAIANNDSHQLLQRVTLPVLNRTWTIYFIAQPLFATESERDLPIISLVCWLTLSFLLFGITCAEVNARSRSEAHHRAIAQIRSRPGRRKRAPGRDALFHRRRCHHHRHHEPHSFAQQSGRAIDRLVPSGSARQTAGEHVQSRSRKHPRTLFPPFGNGPAHRRGLRP